MKNKIGRISYACAFRDFIYGSKIQIDLTDYSFLPNSLISMLTYFNMFSTDEGYIPIFFFTKLFLVDLRPNNKVVFCRTAQET